MPVTSSRSDTSFEDFDPNVPGKGQPTWGVYKENRFHTYKQRAHALSAFNAGHKAKLYEFALDRWVERAVREGYHERPTNPHCDDCGRPCDRNSNSWEWAKYVWDRDLTGKIATPPALSFVCAACRRLRP